MSGIRLYGLAAMLAVVSALGMTGANASVVINGTRVIYNEADPEVTVRLSNENTSPALVQAWLDTGNPNVLPNEAAVPFAIVPPLFRMNPHVGQSLRIIYNRQPLPADVESLFWLNVLEVPPRNTAPEAAAADANLLRFALRSRIKFFYRPKGIVGDPHDAAPSVRWKVVQNGRRYQVEATNPSAYHVTFTRVVVEGKTGNWTSRHGQMLDPHATADFDMEDAGPPSGPPVAFRYTYLDDYGAEVEGTYTPREK